MELKELINMIASLSQMDPPDTIIGLNEEPETRELYYFLKLTVKDILLRRDFRDTEDHILLDTTNFITYLDRNQNPLPMLEEGDSTDRYASQLFRLPQDYFRPIRLPPYYNEEDYRSGRPITSPPGWQEFIDWGYSIRDSFRVNKQARTIETAPIRRFITENGETRLEDDPIQFHYISENWLTRNNGQKSADIGQHEDWTLLLDDELLLYGTLMMIYEHLGWDFTKWKMKYDAKLATKAVDDKPKRKLMPGSSRRRTMDDFQDAKLVWPYRFDVEGS